MKHYPVFPSLLFVTTLASGGPAYAADTMLRNCGKEFKKYSCDAQSESYAYECLVKFQESREKNKGFSGKCYKAYAAYEKETGRGEKVESHQVENPEHN